MTTHKITVEAPSSHEAIAFMASLVAPHFNRPQVVQSRPTDAEVAEKLARHNAAEAEAGHRTPIVSTDEQRASVQPQQVAEELKKPARRQRQKPGITTEPQQEQQTEQRAIVVLSPDGTTKTYDAIGDAIEGITDLLDLCDSVDAVDTFANGVAPIVEQGGADFQKVWAECVQDKRLDMQGASPAVEMPEGDTVGAKAQPAEMSLDNLDPPDFLKKNKLKIDDVRTAFLAMCKATTPATGKLLLDKYEKPRVGELGEDKWPAFYADCKKTSKLDDADWSVALAEAAQIAAKK